MAASPGVARAQPAGGGCVAGTAVDAETGHTLPGVSVRVEGTPQGASVGAGGRFRLGPLAAGDYTLRARFVGYSPETQSVRVAAGDTAQVRLALSPRTIGLEAVEVTAQRDASEVSERLRQSEIREANPRDGGELIRMLPGGSATRRGPIGLDPVVRGLRETQVGVYVDGMRSFPSGPARMDTPLSHTDPFTMQSVQMVKGPYALTWGGGQLSALRVETNGLWRGRGSLSGRVASGYDTNVNAYEVAGTAGGQRGGFGYRVDGVYRRGNSYEAGDGTQVPGDFLSREARAQAGYRWGGGHQITAGGGYQQQDDVDYPGRLLNAAFFKSGRGRVGYEYASGTGLLRAVEAQAYGYQTLHTMNNEGKVTFESTDFPGPPLRVAVNAEVQTAGGRLATELVPAEDLRLTLGGDVYRTYRDAQRPFQIINMMGERVDPPEPPFDRYSPQITPGTVVADAGLFAQATRLFGTVEATGTVRADAVWASADEGQVSDVFLDLANTEASALDQQTTHLSGAFMVTAPLSEAWSVAAGGGTAVRPADALERYADRFPSNRAQTSAEFIGTPALDAERSWQADAELTARYERVSLKLSGFARRIDDFIAFEEAEGVISALPLPIFRQQPVYRYVNGNATFFGGEASGAVAVLPSLTASASGSYLWGQNERAGAPVFGIAPLRGNVGLRFEPQGVLGGRFFAETTLRATCEQRRVAARLSETPTDGYVTLDLKGGFEIGRGVSLEGGMTNVTDVNYVNHLNARDPYAMNAAAAQVPEPGRVFFLNVAYDF